MSELTDSITALSVNYLGPAAGKFLQRQTASHMNGLEYGNIEKKDLPELARWVEISGGLLIDKAKAKELANKIAVL